MTKTIRDAFSQGIFAITLLSYDLDASRDFYQNKLELKEIYKDEVSSVYKAGSTMINLLAATQADELLGPATLSPQNIGTNAVYTLKCPDVNKAVEELKSKGVEMLNGPVDRPWGIRTASFQDPSGHTWELANH